MTQYLLDTHIFLRWTAGASKLSEASKAAIANSENVIYISAVSGWEIATKVRAGTLRLPETPSLFIARMLRQHAFSVLPVTLAHALNEYHLPPLHSDPFDRLLISQTSLEAFTLITDDTLITQYKGRTLW